MATALYRFPAITDNTTTAAATAQPIVLADELEQIALAPLSAGDIIDRAVRLYRLQLLAFIRIVLPPTLLAYAGGILWTIGWRNISIEHGDTRMALMGLSAFFGAVMWIVGKAGFLMVMGASSRALVFHFFRGTPVLARDVYRAVRERWWSLLGATIMLSIFTLVMVFVGYMIAIMVIGIYFIAVMALTQILPGWLMGTMHFVFGLFVAALLIAGGLSAYARVVYTPQAMMVEGKGVFDAFGRSFTLAGREFKRIGAVLLFQICVAWSLYALLLVPLGWYSYFYESDSVSLSGIFYSTGPLWFTIAQQTLTQIAEILIAPIVLLSFTLLYLDSRVRKEGFDVEMLANRVLPQARYETKNAPPVAPIAAPGIRLRDIDWSEELAENVPAATPPAEQMNAVNVPSFIVADNAPLDYTTLPETETIEIAPVNPPAPETLKRFCAACGVTANPRARFCAACGEKL